MGKSLSKLKPKYIKNFNIENKTHDIIDVIEKGKYVKGSPRHPSTVEGFKRNEERASNVDDLEANKAVLKSLKTVKVNSVGDENLATANKAFDKRPKKENESFYIHGGETVVDHVYEKYGYNDPEKVKPGTLTLKQFDEFINLYKKEKSVDCIKEFSKSSEINMTNLHIFLEYYKPFLKIEGKKKSTKDDETLQIGDVFPNVK